MLYEVKSYSGDLLGKASEIVLVKELCKAGHIQGQHSDWPTRRPFDLLFRFAKGRSAPVPPQAGVTAHSGVLRSGRRRPA